MSYPWGNPFRALPNSNYLKSHTFNVHANFQPKEVSWNSDEAMKQEDNKKILMPGASVGSQWCHENKLGIDNPNSMAKCGCVSRKLKICGIPVNQLTMIFELIKYFGEFITDRWAPTDDNTVTLQYFDERSAAGLVQYIEASLGPVYSKISVKQIPDDVDAVVLNGLWGHDISELEIKTVMTKYGDVSHVRVTKTRMGEVFKAVVFYYDFRCCNKIKDEVITIHGITLMPEISRYPHSFSCKGKKDINIGLTADYSSLVPENTLNSRKASLANRGFLMPQSPVLNSVPEYKRFTHHQPYLPALSGHKGVEINVETQLIESMDKKLARSMQALGPIGTKASDSHMSQTKSNHSSTTSSVRGSVNSEYSNRTAYSTIDSSSSINSVFSNSHYLRGDQTAFDPCLEPLIKFAGNHEEAEPKIEYSPKLYQPKTKSESKNDSTMIDLSAIESGIELRTTVMVRNIPNKLEFDDFKQFVDETNKGTYDFLYLRFDFCNKCNVGYGFISFTSTEHVKTFVQRRTGMKWKEHSHNSEKIIEIRFARIQGCDSLVQKFRHSPVMAQDAAFRPRLYHTTGDLAGTEKPFPVN